MSRDLRIDGRLRNRAILFSQSRRPTAWGAEHGQPRICHFEVVGVVVQRYRNRAERGVQLLENLFRLHRAPYLLHRIIPKENPYNSAEPRCDQESPADSPVHYTRRSR